MRSSLYTLRLLLGLLTFSLLVACADSGKDPSPKAAEKINTQHLYLKNNKIYAFSSSSGVSKERANFSSDDMVFSMNTNEKKQGYEYLAYVNDNDVFVMNYVSAKVTMIANPATTICGIFPSYEASQSSFDGSPQQRILIHQPAVIIAVANGSTCDDRTNSLYKSTFDPDGDDGVSITAINSAQTNLTPESHLFGVNVLDYSFSDTVTKNGKSVNVKGRSGFLGYDRDGDQIQLYDKDSNLLWETLLPEADTNTNVRVLSNDKVLIQSDSKLFIKSPAELFDAADLGEKNTSIPMNSALETLFDIESFELSSNDNPIKTASNNQNFCFKDGNAIYFYDNNAIASNVHEVDESLTLLDFDITTTNKLVLHKSETTNNITTELLSLVDSETGSEITEFKAEKIEVRVTNDDLYVNTLNANGQTGWQAHWYEVTLNGIIETTYDNSMFIILDDTRSQNATILLLSSDETELPLQPMQKPSLYAFNFNRTNGRGLKYGQLNSDIYFAHTDAKSAEVINDIYGRLAFDAVFDSVDTTEFYFFKPTQANSNESSFSLKLMSREAK